MARNARLGSRSSRTRPVVIGGRMPSSGGSPMRSTRVRRNRRIAGSLVGFLVLAALAVAGTWVWTRPVSTTIVAVPADAAISSCECSGTGTLEVDDLKPGAYPVTITRNGFAPLETTLQIERFGANSFSFDLVPLPQSLEITSHSPDARVRVLRDGAEVIVDEGSAAGTLTAGPCTVEVSMAGFNTYTRELFLDGPVALDVWLDPEGQLVHSLGIVECAGAPKGVAFTPDGTEAWTTILDGPPSIEIYDTATLQLKDTVDLGTYGAVEVVFSSDGKYAYASQMETAQVFEIDVATREVVRTMQTGSAWSKVVELSPDGTTAFVANWSGNDVSEIDVATGTLRRRIPTVRTPRGLYVSKDGKTLYVAGFAAGDLERIDLASGESKTLFSSGGALRHIVGDPERGVLYVSDMAKDCVWIHDVAKGTTRKFVDTDEKPNTIALSPDHGVLFVSCRGENNAKTYYVPGPEWGTILLFDTSDAAPLDAIVGGNQCTALDVSDDGSMLAFSDFLDSRLRFYAVPDYETLKAGSGGRWDSHFDDLKK